MFVNKIFSVKKQGFCKGVQNAIDQVEKYHHDHPDESLVLFGAPVHNRHVSKKLTDQGIRLVIPGNDPERVLSTLKDCTVLFSAHGISEKLKKQAVSQGLKVVDLSCPFVLSTRQLVNRKLEEGYTIFYIGKKNHPEANAIVSMSDKIHLVETGGEIPQVNGPVFVTNQTTYSILDLEKVHQKIRDQYPSAEFSSEICAATRVRQQAVLDLDPEVFSALIVIGDPDSHNTQKLAQIGEEKGFKTFAIEDLAGLKATELPDGMIALTSGASTPDWIRNEILDYLTGSAGFELESN